MIKTEKTGLLIDIALPDDPNFNTEDTEKLSKYRDQEIGISRMWKLRTKLLSVITGALGKIKRVQVRTFRYT
jgi:hypothetical protein